jgi:hypothetical protein
MPATRAAERPPPKRPCTCARQLNTDYAANPLRAGGHASITTGVRKCTNPNPDLKEAAIAKLLAAAKLKKERERLARDAAAASAA